MKKVVSILLCVALLLTVVLSACSADTTNKMPDAADREGSLKANLTQLFAAPNPGSVSFIEEELPQMGLETMSPETIQDTIKEGMLDKVLATMTEDKKNVVSESIMKDAWANGLYEISSLCIGNDGKTKISDIQITPSEEYDTVLDFTATVSCTKDGNTQDVELNGSASFDANGKLMSINYGEGMEEIINALK